MKVKCIKNGYWPNLTIGKTYEVITHDKWNYRIINNKGFQCWYHIEHFKPLSEIRNETINKLLE